MFKNYRFHANFNERTGYGIHASRFGEAFDKLFNERKSKDDAGEIHISLLDTVSASNAKQFPPEPSILYNVWESTEQPQEFINNLKHYTQLWVPSEAQKSWSVSQGIPEEIIKVVPEGVNPDVYKPIEVVEKTDTFNFLHCGQWQPRKSTEEICRAFIKAFPNEDNVRLYLSADTLFPSDQYKSTEERLEAYGLNDPRIIPVHFEERNDYIRRLQNAHCFVSCARSEGWGLPIIEAMACGIPTIVADWGGSTEYHDGAITVPVKRLIKPFGIFGNWDVPGQWCEPDFDVLVERYKEVYDQYGYHKERALLLSDKIRTKFSWEEAAKKAYRHLEELSGKYTKIVPEVTTLAPLTPLGESLKENVIAFALSHGFKITGLEPIEKSAFVIGCWPDTPEKVDTLIETINQVKAYGYPVIISTHYPNLPASINGLVDYVIYDRSNVLSDDWRATYTRPDGKGGVDKKKCSKPYHAVACLNAIRNAVDFSVGKFDRLYYLEYDSEVDYNEIINATKATNKPFIGITYETNGIRTDVWSGKVRWLADNVPIVHSWAEYTKDMKNVDCEYIFEYWLKNKFLQHSTESDLHLIDTTVTNRFDQVDHDIWDYETFGINFFDGPRFSIYGISNRVYDVKFEVNGVTKFALQQKPNMESSASLKFYQPWTVTASLNGEEKFRHTMDLKGKRVLIQFGSKALGDSIAWMPYVDEFRKKHDCKVVCSGWWQEIFDYPEIEFVKPGSQVGDLYASYVVGCFDEQLDKNPLDWRTVPLQKVASDILGLEYEPLRAKLKGAEYSPSLFKPFVCFSEFSTMRNKMWNREGGWQKVVDYLNFIEYNPVSISVETSGLKNIINHNAQSLQQTIKDIANCEFYIGLNHGPAWIAYALNKPVIMITGVSQEWNDFPNSHRIAINMGVCGTGCFNDPTLKIDRGWEWCARGKDYACTREITEDMVVAEINKVIQEIHD